MNDNERLELIYAEADKMRDEAVAKVRRLHLFFIFGSLVTVFVTAITLSYHFLLLFPMVVAHILLLSYFMRRTRGFETWKWNLIKNHLPNPVNGTEPPEWIRKMLHLYSKRIAYRPVDDEPEDKADYWKWN